MMAGGLYSNWKEPIYYNFDTDMIKDLLNDTVHQLYICGYTVFAIVSAIGTTNIGLWNY